MSDFDIKMLQQSTESQFSAAWTLVGMKQLENKVGLLLS